MPEQNEPLSEREIEILRLVATGAANKEIARQLAISPNTVKVHLRNIFSKAGVFSRTEATLYAIQMGWVTPSSAVMTEEAETPADIPTDGTERTTTGDLAPSIVSSPALSRAAEGEAPVEFRRIQPWQVGLIVVLALLLVGAGVATSQFFMPQITPTVSSQAVLPTSSPQHWTARADIPSPRKGMGVAEYNGDFYMIGGETAKGVDGAVMRYDPTGNTWKPLASKPTPVTEVQAALLGERIYVPGGRMANGESSDQLEVYNPRNNAWEHKASLPIPLSGYALASFEGRLYLFGGKSGNQYISKVFEYDPQGDRWQERTSMSAPRAYASAVNTGENIHVIGGFDGKKALALHEVYFPTRDSSNEPAWQGIDPLPQGRYGMGASHLAGIIFLLGGMTDNNTSPNPPAIEYVIQNSQWGKFDAPPGKVGAFPALLASGNFIYVLGGETSGAQPGTLSAANESYQAIYTNFAPILSNNK